MSDIVAGLVSYACEKDPDNGSIDEKKRGGGEARGSAFEGVYKPKDMV